MHSFNRTTNYFVYTLYIQRYNNTHFEQTNMSMAQKPTIRAIINVTGIPHTYKQQHADGTITYIGLFYDVYQKIKQSLSDKYTFVETFDENFSMSKALDDIREGKYDIGVHNFTTTAKRLEELDFTKSIIMERDVIVYKAKNGVNARTVANIMTEVLLIPVIVIICFSIVIGWLVYYFQGGRNKDMSSPLRLRRSIIATISVFLAEAGMMAEESPLNFTSIFFTMLIMVVALAFNTYLTASVTNRVIEINASTKYTAETIPAMHILALKDQSIADKFRRYGTRVTEMPTNIKKMITKYMENTNKYDGVALETSAAIVVAKKYDLKMTSANFGFGDAVFALNKNKHGLLEDINKEIQKMQDSMETERICKKYIDDQYSYLCVL